MKAAASLLGSIGNGCIYTPLIRMSIRALERMTTRPNALAHVQSFDHLITRAILLHYLTTLLLYNSRIKTQDLLIAKRSF